MSDELRRQNIEALLDERRGYEVRLVDAEGDTKTALNERIGAVNAALARLGYDKPKTAAVKTSAKKPAAAKTSKKAPARGK